MTHPEGCGKKRRTAPQRQTRLHPHRWLKTTLPAHNTDKTSGVHGHRRQRHLSIETMCIKERKGTLSLFLCSLSYVQSGMHPQHQARNTDPACALLIAPSTPNPNTEKSPARPRANNAAAARGSPANAAGTGAAPDEFLL